MWNITRIRNIYKHWFFFFFFALNIFRRSSRVLVKRGGKKDKLVFLRHETRRVSLANAVPVVPAGCVRLWSSSEWLCWWNLALAFLLLLLEPAFLWEGSMIQTTEKNMSYLAHAITYLTRWVCFLFLPSSWNLITSVINRLTASARIPLLMEKPPPLRLV